MIYDEINFGCSFDLKAFCRQGTVAGSLNKYIHLLADVHGSRGPVKFENDLQNPRVHPFGAVAGQRFLRDYLRFNPHKAQRDRAFGVAF